MTHEEAADWARKLAALRRRADLVCAVCDRPFQGVKRDDLVARYCSRKCQNKAYQQRLKEKVVARTTYPTRAE